MKTATTFPIGAHVWQVSEALVYRATIVAKRSDTIYETIRPDCGGRAHISIAFADELFATELEAVEHALSYAEERVGSLTWRRDRLTINAGKEVAAV
jgi:hypothetical protein